MTSPHGQQENSRLFSCNWNGSLRITRATTPSLSGSSQARRGRPGPRLAPHIRPHSNRSLVFKFNSFLLSSGEGSPRRVTRMPKIWAPSSPASAVSSLTTGCQKTMSSSSSSSPSTPHQITGTTRASNWSRPKTGFLAAIARYTTILSSLIPCF